MMVELNVILSLFHLYMTKAKNTKQSNHAMDPQYRFLPQLILCIYLRVSRTSENWTKNTMCRLKFQK